MDWKPKHVFVLVRDEVDWAGALSSPDVDVRLVDHNLLSKREVDLGRRYFDKIVEVVDHHRQETEFPSSVKVHLKRDGSCTSQVFALCERANFEVTDALARLMIGMIPSLIG
jgi:inorganic pyrophosphatase/exopolyphosphatase